MKKRKLLALLEEAARLLETGRCPNEGCDGAGTLLPGQDDIEQCQWCWERDRAVRKARKELAL